MRKQAKTLTATQLRTALAATTRQGRYPDRDRTIILLSHKAGLRAGEIAKLTWPMVLNAEGEVADHIELHDLAAKKRSGRAIPLHSDLKRALTRLRRRCDGEGPVIRSERGRAMRPTSIVNFFASLYRRLGFAGCSSHSGRRGFLTRAARLVAKSGGSLRDVQLLAGHRSIEQTQAYIDGDSKAHRSHWTAYRSMGRFRSRIIPASGRAARIDKPRRGGGFASRDPLELLRHFRECNSQLADDRAVQHCAVRHEVHPLLHGHVEERVAGLHESPTPMEDATSRLAGGSLRHVIGGRLVAVGSDAPHVPIALLPRPILHGQALYHVQPAGSLALADAIRRYPAGGPTRPILAYPPGPDMASEEIDGIEGGRAAGEGLDRERARAAAESRQDEAGLNQQGEAHDVRGRSCRLSAQYH